MSVDRGLAAYGLDRELPGVARQRGIAGTRRVRLELAWTEQDPDTCGTQRLNAPCKRNVCGQPLIHIRQYDDAYSPTR